MGVARLEDLSEKARATATRAILKGHILAEFVLEHGEPPFGGHVMAFCTRCTTAAGCLECNEEVFIAPCLGA